jgi:hypothetical protein
MEGHTVVCVNGREIFVIYTGSGRHLDGPRGRHSGEWLSPTLIFYGRVYGGVSCLLALLSNATASVILLDLTLPIRPKQAHLPENFILKNAKREACPKAPSHKHTYLVDISFKTIPYI